MSKDTLFQHTTMDSFVFDERVAAVFPDMVTRSVPGYHTVMELIGDIFAQILTPGATVCDLGCSVGTAVFYLAHRLRHLGLSFVGVDSSAAMIARADGMRASFAGNDSIRFVQHDILTYPLHEVAAVMLQYTLQFVAVDMRKPFLSRVRRGLKPGAIAVLSEKVRSASDTHETLFVAQHEKFKKAHGYSNLEIARKRDALDSVLVPLSVQENMELLRQSGFSHVDLFFKWCNFASFLATAD